MDPPDDIIDASPLVGMDASADPVAEAPPTRTPFIVKTAAAGMTPVEMNSPPMPLDCIMPALPGPIAAADAAEGMEVADLVFAARGPIGAAQAEASWRPRIVKLRTDFMVR